MATNQRSSHAWRFFRAGGFDQVKLDRGSDFLAIDQLDLKLWVALACPTTGIEFDKTTLNLIDTDKDGRIRAPELIEAVKWVGRLLKNPDDLLKSSPALPLAAINDSDAEGKRIVNFAKQVLGVSDAGEVDVDQASKAAKTFAAKPFNGDGIITPDGALDEATKSVINDIIATQGADLDASGKSGVNQAKVDKFLAELSAYSTWWGKGEGNAAVLPLGPATPVASAAIEAVRAKVEDYFARCRLAAFDPRSANALNRDEKEFAALATKELTVSAPEVSGFPLARVQASTPLPLKAGINPAWAGAVSALQASAVKPLLGDLSVLTEDDWFKLTGKLAEYQAWSAGKAGASVETLGLARIRAILSSTAKDQLASLLAKEKAEETNAQAVASLIRLVYYHRDLNQLCHNFVSFRDFYQRERKAVFQAGTLYLDQRSCDLCLAVEDPGKHAAMAALAGTYLAYCDCVRKGTGEKMQIVAAFTGGDSDDLMVGRNGVFFDRKGRDWDATITKIIDNPISIRQAFFAPYKKLVRMIEEQVAKRAAAADAAADAKLAAVAKATAGGEPPPPAPEPKKIDTGTLAAIGLVLATLFGALGTIFAKIFGLPMWQIPLAFVAIGLAISGPSMLIAYLKLRRRNLGPILDANGWAVNAKAKMNVPFGGSLTRVASLPPGSQRDLVDPFAEKKSPWPTIIVLLLILIGAAYLVFKFGLVKF